MRTGFRTLAALLALIAFSASFAEQVWAGTCAAEAAGTRHAAPASHAHGGMTIPADHPDPHPATPDDSGCPVRAVAAGCALILFAVTATDEAPAAPADGARIAPRADPSIELLLVSSFFRPPQR
jgi:hypothetical protein